MAESSERKYPNVKYSWKTTLGKSNCSIFSDCVNFFAILPGCSVVGLNWRNWLLFLFLFHLHLYYILILSQQPISAIFGGKQSRIVGDIFFSHDITSYYPGVLKAALSLPLSAAGSQLSNLVVRPYQLSELPLPLGCRPRNARHMWSYCLALSTPYPTLWKALADFSWIGETGRGFKIPSFYKRWIQFVLDTG